MPSSLVGTCLIKIKNAPRAALQTTTSLVGFLDRNEVRRTTVRVSHASAKREVAPPCVLQPSFKNVTQFFIARLASVNERSPPPHAPHAHYTTLYMIMRTHRDDVEREINGRGWGILAPPSLLRVPRVVSCVRRTLSFTHILAPPRYPCSPIATETSLLVSVLSFVLVV